MEDVQILVQLPIHYTRIQRTTAYPACIKCLKKIKITTRTPDALHGEISITPRRLRLPPPNSRLEEAPSHERFKASRSRWGRHREAHQSEAYPEHPRSWTETRRRRQPPAREPQARSDLLFFCVTSSHLRTFKIESRWPRHPSKTTIHCRPDAAWDPLRHFKQQKEKKPHTIHRCHFRSTEAKWSLHQ